MFFLAAPKKFLIQKGAWGRMQRPSATACVTKGIALQVERSKDFRRILGENLLTLMTQILREAAGKMVSSLSFKIFKMKFEKKPVRPNDCQPLLYHSQGVDHTHYYAACGC